jgi:hypothetical protein
LLDPEPGESFLDRASLTLRSAPGLDEALVLAGGWSPHLIVLHGKPQTDEARMFCANVRALRPVPRLLLVTEHLPGDTHDPTEVPCDAHLVSPVAFEQLLSTIAELVDVRRRRHERVPLDVLVHTEGFAFDQAVDATLSTGVNLSEDGMLVEANRQLGIGARGRLLFFLPDQAERLSIEARVRAAVDELRLLYVMEFIDLPPQHRTLIRRYIESQREAA